MAPALRRAAWFAALWAGGVAAVLLLGLAIRAVLF